MIFRTDRVRIHKVMGILLKIPLLLLAGNEPPKPGGVFVGGGDRRENGCVSGSAVDGIEN